MQKYNQKICQFIIDHVSDHPKDITTFVSTHFHVARVTANRYLQRLLQQKLIIAEGSTKARTYQLVNFVDQSFSFNTQGLQEDEVWRIYLFPLISDLKKNVIDLCQFAVTEMVNNVIDHSASSTVFIQLKRNAKNIQINIADKGIGIFEKIQKKFNLVDPMHAVLELSKGKLTTDPKNHSGEGIFFTSRMVDIFRLTSGNISYSKEPDDEGQLTEVNYSLKGTAIQLIVDTQTSRIDKDIFDQYTDDEYRFSKTLVPVNLVRYGEEQLVSRSQAKRLLARFEKFSEIMLDFKGVEKIGQAFADEIFRVFKNAHPQIHLLTINTTEQIRRMMSHVQQ